MITTFDSTLIAFIAKNATLPHRDGQVWVCLRQRQKLLVDFFWGNPPDKKPYGRDWTRPVKSGTTAQQRFRSSTG